MLSQLGLTKPTQQVEEVSTMRTTASETDSIQPERLSPRRKWPLTLSTTRGISSDQSGSSTTPSHSPISLTALSSPNSSQQRVSSRANSPGRSGIPNTRLIDMLYDPICLIADNGLIIHSNPAFQSRFLIEENSPRHSIFHVIPGNTTSVLRCIVNATSCDSPNSETLERCETISLRQKGIKLYYDWTFASDDGKLYVMVSGKPSDAQQAIKDSHKINKTLLRSINHELRSPLNAALSGLAMLQQNDPSTDRSGLIKIVKASVISVSDALDDTLLHHAFGSESFMLQKTEQCIALQLNDIVEYARVEAGERNVTMTFEEPEHKPLVNFDAGKIQQVLRNGVLYVLRATASAGTVASTCSYDATSVHITIHSSAMTELDAPSNDELDPFLIPFQKVVHMHMGTMGIRNHEGHSLECYITLPLRHLEAIKLPPDPPPEPPKLPSLPASLEIERKLPVIASTVPVQRRILVVDDSQLCRKMTVKRLESLGVQCDEVENGSDAVIKVMTVMRTGVAYHAILMDNTMPVLNGVTATKMIRDFGYPGKIYGVTGNVLKDDMTSFMANGATEVFVKPLRPANYDAIIKGDSIEYCSLHVLSDSSA